MTNCQLMETQNFVILFDYSWFLAKNLAYAKCPIMKFHYRNSSSNQWPFLGRWKIFYFSRFFFNSSIFQFRNITDLQVRRSGTMITLNARSNEKKLTIMAMVLILVFVICNSFYTIYFPLKYGKVILYKSRKELSLLVQYTNEWAYS